MPGYAELTKTLNNQGVIYFFGAYVDGLGVPKSNRPCGNSS